MGSAMNLMVTEISRQELFHSFLEKNILNRDDVQKINALQNFGQDNLSIPRLIVNLGFSSEKEVLQHLSGLFSIPLLDVADYPASLVENSPFNPLFLREQHLVPISCEAESMDLCLSDPLDESLLRAIRFASDKKINLYLGLQKEIDEHLDKMLRDEKDEVDEISAALDSHDLTHLEKDIRQLRELASEAPVIKFVNLILQGAVEQNASDIHIEPQADHIRVRYRVDGLLQDARTAPLNIAAAIISRIKILAALDIAQRRVPQDGRFDISVDGNSIDVRASVLPTIHGESLVLRLLYNKKVSFDFEALGYSAGNLKKIKQLLKRPHGMILVTGPTGSGKSTTLYAMLQEINDSVKKIISVEDPVEYKIEGINQIQVNPDVGVSFASALRAIVRHDPEVIMVGEMRDSITAEIGIRASMTGHLILSTLHTNSAVASIDRLVDLGIDRSFVFSSLNGVIAQRLVRRLCDHCKEVEWLDPAALMIPDAQCYFENDEPVQCYKPVGCEQCNQTGFNGRIAISEVMMVNEALQAAALLGEESLASLAKKAGLEPIVIDGLHKVLEGQTSLEELYRVTLDQ